MMLLELKDESTHLCPRISIMGGQYTDCRVFIRSMIIYVLELAVMQA